MMIAVIGQHESSVQLDTMPWEVDRIDDNSIRVFGITLGKTTVQESNQILAQFGKTQLEVKTGADQKPHFQLSSTYDDLLIGGLIAQIKITYQINQKKLQSIYNSIRSSSSQPQATAYPLTRDIEMEYLNTPISTITYIPSIDYGEDTLLQNFGPAAEEIKVNENETIWLYPKMGLKIYILKNKPDRFVYAQLTQHL